LLYCYHLFSSGSLFGTCMTILLFIVYADISMQDKVMVFENEKQLIGWGPGDCSRVPKSRDVSI